MARDVQPAVPARLAAGAPSPMTLLHPSFRGRLRLFFAVIVVVPMIAVGVALFFLLDAGDKSKFNSSLGTAQTVAQHLFQESRSNAMVAGEKLQSDVALATAIHDDDPPAIKRRLEEHGEPLGADWVKLD